ncbi:MAG TPA: NrfD/PsrC family molybdoenzyme membrane anchor subunit [Planctomycetota bacterium]|nr:NrfD/PsrC family molybdoenzyme membrane anchor subunit [Planctomycetota bacterium]
MSVAEAPVLHGRPGDLEVTDQVLAPLWAGSRAWAALLGLSAAGVGLLVVAITYTVVTGIGVWGNNIPVGWAYGIINFVWWIGLGHAGTFISAVLLLLEQSWRNSINRLAEAMTLFAVVNAGLYPLLHLGRPWFFYWLIPYPSTMELWPQFKSALPWDIAAISTYGLVSFLFWYLGLLPDLAAARDRAPDLRRARFYGVCALGWRGSSRDWSRLRVGYGLLAGLATPLVISVHSVVSFDFAITQVPGWHSTIFPPYFVVGAIFSGFALVLILVIPIRRVYRIENLITERHLDAMGKVLLVTGSIMLYAYVVETFVAWYSGNLYERFIFLVRRPFGPYASAYWAMWILNAFAPQLLWIRSVRRRPLPLFLLSVAILVGMWLERFVLIVTSLDRDFLPSSWDLYAPTWVDWSLLAGTLGLFSFLFLLFLRLVPIVPIYEIKRLRHELELGHAG